MTRFHTFFFGLCLLGATAARAAGPDPAVQSMMTQYLTIQSQLAADSIDQVKAAALEIEKGAKGATSDKGMAQQAARAAAKVAGAKDLVQARKEFKELSKPFVKWAERNKPADVEVVYCSMAGAKWVQTKGDVRNPYYGKEMLECGEKVQ